MHTYMFMQILPIGVIRVAGVVDKMKRRALQRLPPLLHQFTAHTTHAWIIRKYLAYRLHLNPGHCLINVQTVRLCQVQFPVNLRRNGSRFLALLADTHATLMVTL